MAPAVTLQLSCETFTFQIATFLLKGRTVTFEKFLSARCCTFQGFTKWNMFIPVNVTVLQQLLRAKSEISSSVLIRQDAVSCGNDVEVVFVLVDNNVARVPLPLSTIGTGKATMSPMLPACSSKSIVSAWSVRHSLALFLSLRMLRRRNPSGERLSSSGRQAGSWSSDRDVDTSFRGTLRALSRSSSDCRV